jgi:hypothetical protein
MPRPKAGVTPVRNIRIGEKLWRAAQQSARSQGQTLTAVIERALVDYVAEHPVSPAAPDGAGEPGQQVEQP